MNEALKGNKPGVERTRRLLMFLTVLWQAGTLGAFHPQMVSSFLSTLGKKLSARDPSVGTLGRDILNALVALETLVPGSLGKDKDSDCAGIWLASLDSDPENLLDACMYLPGRDRITDSLAPVQLRSPTMWSYLWVLENVMLCLSRRLGIICGTACCSSLPDTTSATKSLLRWLLLLLCVLP